MMAKCLDHLRSKDGRWNASLALLTAGMVALLLTILLFLMSEAWPFLISADTGHGGNRLFTNLLQNPGWYPLEGRFGLAPMILASLAVMLGAILIALPLGLINGIYLEFYASAAFARGFRLLLNLLAGIPSVVFGLWGLTRLVPWITQWQPPGASLLAAILVLSLMILPTIALTSASALASVPRELHTGAIALGLRRTSQIIHIMLPAARSGIVAGTILAAARALGETMAVLMVAGNVVQIPATLFEPVRVLTANMALEMAYAVGEHRASLFASGLLLTLVVWGLSWMAYRLGRHQRKFARHD
ncbi:MAG: phosphate ABC transporter permease subunit PstC [Pseudomonadales bacterium]|jgi:phosphate transport system permease protein|nr:phosphate ABC transporter permease subunit PstC [Pseudomonadales bacterium]MBI27910.1 phosphate ABC transporter permease subunit PstC [Pseudomonadales bacterium]MCK5790928.1 phosphate ABC transporter permease subunit PstC [Ketobacter sp.]MEC8812685.1 phosphate ABC transporter permease subunit PstC [Pseudomonadota bacterium]HCB38126.1 phosphate ABC transporter permease subunit PstC [Gammaproteobacteria bacterium]|tara:strand:+ start:15156 stop:16064 length:909 start_codon:yes stop_codon:yes gene_type:complete